MEQGRFMRKGFETKLLTSVGFHLHKKKILKREKKKKQTLLKCTSYFTSWINYYSLQMNLLFQVMFIHETQ